jgi:hypothetical protein
MKALLVRHQNSVGIGIIVALAISFGFHHLSAPESLESVADRCVKAIEDGNSTELYNLLLDKEIAAQRITPTSLRSLLDNYVLPGLKGKSGVGARQIRPIREYGMLAESITWNRPGQTPIGVGALVVATPNGGHPINVVRDLIIGTFMAKYGGDKTRDMLLTQIEGIEKDGPYLRSVGFSGFYNSEMDRVQTWDELLAYDKKMSKKLHMTQ